MFKKAFTLAETLLVMAIIGIVATATIPNLMDSYQEDRDVAKLTGINERTFRRYRKKFDVHR